MTGETKSLSLAEGIALTAPTQNPVTANKIGSYASTSAYVTANGAATEGAAFANTTTHKINWYNNSTWQVVHDYKDDFAAASAPTVNEDSGDGFEKGSLIYVPTTGKLYWCADATVGAASWKELVDASSTQSITGAKTFSAAVNISNDTESTDKDTGCLILAGGLGVEKNVNVGGDLQVTGNLTVQGTTTTINTQTLDVEDANININNGGNEASAHDIAGINIEMSDAVDAQILFDKNLASFFKIGKAGTLKEAVDVSSTQALTNKDYDCGTASDTSRITVGKNTTANLNGLTKKEGVIVYDTTTKKLKVGDDSKWLTVGSSGGGSAINWRLDYAIAPLEENSGGVPLLDFDYTEAAGVYCLLTVPTDYVAGTQILLKNGKFATTATTGDVLFKLRTYLIKAGSTVLGTYSDYHDSTNTTVTVDGDASTVTAIGDMDATDTSGEINSVAVAGGDQLLILMTRAVASESSSAAAYARFLRDSATPFFG